MPLPLQTLRKLIQKIYSSHDQELDCEGFLEAIPEYVDMEVAGDEAHLHFPMVYHHMTQCSHCKDLYLGMMDAAQLEAQEEAQEEAQAMVRVSSTKRPLCDDTAEAPCPL